MAHFELSLDFVVDLLSHDDVREGNGEDDGAVDEAEDEDGSGG